MLIIADPNVILFFTENFKIKSLIPTNYYLILMLTEFSPGFGLNANFLRRNCCIQFHLHLSNTLN